MELALSVGGEPSRNWGTCNASDDRIQQTHVGGDYRERRGSKNFTPIQLDLRLSWSTDTGNGYEIDVNELPTVNDVGPSSSDSRPNDAGKRDWKMDAERASSKCSDEEEGGSTRKKLRLSKDQSCYLEESFKEHPTLNPKQKLALAKQLNLRPRQVEVWFQNRRARTKLKQTEVDCEYLKRCCESLTEENRRLHKELQDLKALKAPLNPFQVQSGAVTTLTMCPSCELVSTTTDNMRKTANFGVPKSRFYPFSQHTSATS